MTTKWDEEWEKKTRALIAMRSQAHVRELLEAYDDLKKQNAELVADAAEFDASLSETVEINTKPLLEEIQRLRGVLLGIVSIAGQNAIDPNTSPAIHFPIPADKEETSWGVHFAKIGREVGKTSDGLFRAPEGSLPKPSIEIRGEMWRTTAEESARTVYCDVVGCTWPSYETQGGHELCCPHAVEYKEGQYPFGSGPFQFKSEQG